MSDKQLRMCPLLIGKEERKAITYGQGDIVVPIIYPCIEDKCMAFAGKSCMYWQRECYTEVSDHGDK